MAHPRSEKYSNTKTAYCSKGKDHYRPVNYGKRGRPKSSESGKGDRCRRKSAWFAGADDPNAKHSSKHAAGMTFRNALRKAGYRHVGNGTWITKDNRPARVCSGN